ncbi:EAL domain-containing protein [Bacillus weihaiensis]|uniref:PAS domain S-box protein n=1 Tax=Bacillus weihaiensis TaxID=1547283 RepID=A0A1L3MN20_9BACI|nr:EAL domain-containing protein [Bacillus weihaiensis]APH03664.1 hypothetical protein A9C19_02210 [Bacillus weihaiensis]
MKRSSKHNLILFFTVTFLLLLATILKFHTFVIIGTIILITIISLHSLLNRQLILKQWKGTKTKQSYRSLFDHHPDIVIRFTKDGQITSINKTVERVLGFKVEECIGHHFLEGVNEEKRNVTLRHFNMAAKGEATTYDSVILHKDGRSIYVTTTNIPIIVNGEIDGVYGITRDITEQKKIEQIIQKIAYEDVLTGLPNRTRLIQYLTKQLKVATTTNRTLAVLFIDMDRFKVVNDTIGHSSGDEMLKEVADRLQATIRKDDMIFRQSGDEFVVVLNNATREVAEDVARKMIAAFEKPIHIHTYDIFTSPSIGISFFPEDGNSLEELIKHADAAMYQSKASGKKMYTFYSSHDADKKMDRLKLEMDLHKAIERNELLLHYQPKVNLKTGHVVGVEALIRWNHAEIGLISPAEFIPIAEETGLIISIGEWALKTACTVNKHWQEEGLQNLVISVNLSPRQFSQTDLVKTVEKVLEETGLESHLLELEITESMTADIERTISTLHELKQLGVRISIDDFGTGFSSLNYLKRFPVDTLKVDQSFVNELHNNPNDETIVKTIIAMGHNLGLHVVAEGIETKEQLVFLQQYVCDEGQGYFFSKPLPAQELVEKIKEIEQIVPLQGITKELNDRIWADELVRGAKKDLQEILRLQQSMTIKYKKIGDKFVHTMCDGELVYRFGLLPEQIIGKQLFDLLPEEVSKKKVSYYQRAWDGEGNVHYEDVLNGICYLATLRPVIKGGEVTEVIGSFVDITKQKQVEKKLRESQELHQLIAKHIIDLVTIYTLDGRITYASSSYERVLGYKPAELVGSIPTNLYHHEDLQRMLFDLQEAKKTNQNQSRNIQKKYRLKNKQGTYLTFHTILTTILNENGEVERIIGVSRESTE